MEFTKCVAGDWSTYPEKRGQYLIKYYDETTPFYMIAYFRPLDEIDILGVERAKGFYFDADCSKEANIETKWNYKPFEWMFLPNLLQANGLYE